MVFGGAGEGGTWRINGYLANIDCKANRNKVIGGWRRERSVLLGYG